MRKITTHAVNPVNEAISVAAVDAPGAGGANHQYVVKYPGFNLVIPFQNGPVNEVGLNGITQEILLAIVRDRLEGFQSGEYACEENQFALEAVMTAQEALASRTKAQIERGVEGTHTV